MYRIRKLLFTQTSYESSADVLLTNPLASETAATATTLVESQCGNQTPNCSRSSAHSRHSFHPFDLILHFCLSALREQPNCQI